jgi:hypothetical protein
MAAIEPHEKISLRAQLVPVALEGVILLDR